MKLNKNEQNYLLTILFKSYILQSVICSGIILVCTVSLDMGLTWVLDRYVEHYYLIYSLSLTPFNVVGTVNDGTDIPTVYLDAHSIELLVPNMWKVKNATVHWHSEAGITMRQMYSSLHDILEDTIGGNLDIIGKSDIGDTYNSVLSVLQLGLLVTSFLLLFVSVLGQINIGLSSLEQRTHELLIRRAIGASRANIVTLVLGAQLTISVFVCIVSILISFFLVQGMGLFLPVDSPVAALEYPILSAVVAVITSVVVALLGGLLPALKAAKLEPALALR